MRPCPQGRGLPTNGHISLGSLFNKDFRGVECPNDGLSVRPATFDERRLLVIADETDDLVFRMLFNEKADHMASNEASNTGDEDGGVR